MVQDAKLLLGTTIPYRRVMLQVLAPQLWIQLPANVPGKAADDGPGIWVAATHLTDPDGLAQF